MEDPFGLRAGDTVDRYRILESIGIGGMGVVYRAQDPKLDREIALKLVRADRQDDGGQSQTRLLREAQAMAQVSHPNVLPIYDVGTLEAGVFIAMEYIQGQSLPQWMQEQTRAPEEIVDVFVEAGRGLAAVHLAGLIHRDFKPSNVLLDHRVLIMDFGLARATGTPSTEDGPSPDELPSTPLPGGILSTELTQVGTILGTPAYMAPEQMVAGRDVDERCDQYGFCASLFEMLHGHRPFDGESMLDLYRAKHHQRWAEVEASSPFVRQVMEVVHRGLAADPDQRWPSMTALVDALAQLRTPTRRRRWLPWTLAGAVGAIAGAALWPSSDEPSPCGEEDGLAGIWDEDQRQAVRAAWEDSGAPYWEQAWGTVSPRLDAYADAWRAQHVAVCEANRSPEPEDPALLDQRARCLDDRRRRLAALAETLGRSEPEVVETAAAGVAGLARIESCEDTRYLANALEPPTTPREALAVARLRESLARVDALTDTERFDDALTLARTVLEAAEGQDYAPVQVEAQHRLGRLMMFGSEPSESVEVLSKSYFRARELGHDEVALAAATDLIRAEDLGHHYEDGLHWARTAESLLPTVGDEPSQRALLMRRKGSMVADMGRQQEGIEMLERAAAIQREVFGDDDPRVAVTLLALGRNLRRREGRVDEAVQILREALATAESAFNPVHPSVSRYANGLGNALVMSGKLDDALVHYERADSITRAALGDEHPERAGLLISRSQIHTRRREFERSIALISKALEIWEEAHGPDHPRVGLAVNNLGVAYEGKGDTAMASSLYRRALRIARATLGEDHPHVAVSHRNLAETLLDLGKDQEARTQFQTVLDIATRSEVAPDDVALAHFGLARLDWKAGTDRATTRATIERAHAALAEQGPFVQAEADAVATWLREHPLEP